MSQDSNPVSFRVSAEDRLILEALAADMGGNVSAFVRDVVLDVTRELVKRRGGPEKVLREYKKKQRSIHDEKMKSVEAVLAARPDLN